MATAYWTIAGITFAIVIFAFVSDRDADKRDPRSLIFVAAATLLWPVTLPFILRQQYRQLKARQHARQKAKVLKQLQQQLAHGESAAMMPSSLQVD